MNVIGDAKIRIKMREKNIKTDLILTDPAPKMVFLMGQKVF